LPDQPETVEQAAAAANHRWRIIAIGLVIVLLTNLANAAMNALALRDAPPIICVAAINNPKLAEQAIQQRVDQHRARFAVPKR